MGKIKQRNSGGALLVGIVVAVALAIAIPLAVMMRDQTSDSTVAIDAPPDPLAEAPAVTCGQGSWPVSAMDGERTGNVDDAEVRAAFAAILRGAPLDAPRPIAEEGPSKVDWILLDDEPMVLGVGEWSAAGGPGQTAQSMSLERTSDGLSVNGWGDCQLSVALPPGRAQVEVTKARVDPTGEVVVSVNERDCTSARDPRPFLGEPQMVETDDRVLVFVTSEQLRGVATCQGNPSVDVALDLAEPLGNRELYDAGVWPYRLVAVGGSSNVQ